MKQATVGWELVPKMQLQVSCHHGHPLSPWKPLRVLVIFLWYLSQKHFFPPAVLSDPNALIPLIMPTLDVLMNQFLPTCQFQVRDELLPFLWMALWRYGPEWRTIGPNILEQRRRTTLSL